MKLVYVNWDVSTLIVMLSVRCQTKTENNLILEEDATLAHLLPNPPGAIYLFGWLDCPEKGDSAGKQKVTVPKLKRAVK